MTQTGAERCYLGVDAGTGSARAGVFDSSGKMLGQCIKDITTWQPESDFVEQSSADIWEACCQAVKGALGSAGMRAAHVRGIGFAATCSLVVLGGRDEPVTVSPTGKDNQNVIVWMDHRAIDQARRINATGHKALDYVGGKISPEMQSPKLLWLKENMPETWKRAERFFDLADFLTYRATGDDGRSLCTTVCKWTYLGHAEATVPGSTGRWDDSYWQRIGLGELVGEGHKRLGRTVRPLGEPLGRGLATRAAAELGLVAGIPVGVSAIDAHAGGIGLLGAQLDGHPPSIEDMDGRLALIMGTSSCHMANTQEARHIPGVWGPYFSAMIPGMWLNEGGQSATGSLVDHIIFSHARGTELRAESKISGKTVYELLDVCLEALEGQAEFPAALTRDLHVLPYFHGNRSPLADPTLRGIVSGLKLSDTIDDLALLYLAVIQAIAHGTRHIISTMNEYGYHINTIFACGGGTKNSVFLREHADITGCRIILPREPEAVLLGSAILAAVASGSFKSVMGGMLVMDSVGEVIEPTGGDVRRFHDAKHQVFLQMHDDLLKYRSVMDSGRK